MGGGGSLFGGQQAQPSLLGGTVPPGSLSKPGTLFGGQPTTALGTNFGVPQ